MRTLAQKLTVLLSLAFSAFCLWKAAPGVIADAKSAFNPTAQASIKENSSSGSNGVVSRNRLITTPIQNLRVGMRVVGRNPLAEDADRDLPEPDPKTWRLVCVRMEHKPGEFVDAELLRPLEWIKQNDARANAKIWLELAEMQAAGWANVIAIDPCPPIEPGDNPIITGTFQHVADKLAEVWVDGLNQPIICTAKHPFWSNTQKAFVSADELQPGEKVVSAFGIDTTVKEIRLRQDRQKVYGLEVFGEHVYQVGQLGLLAHNASQKAPSGGVLAPSEGGLIRANSWAKFRKSTKGWFTRNTSFFSKRNPAADASQGYHWYKHARSTTDTPVLGTLPAVRGFLRRKTTTGFYRLNARPWQLQVNDSWLAGHIEARSRFRVISDMADPKNLTTRLRSGEVVESVFARELRILQKVHGYRYVADSSGFGGWLVPPAS